jgi:hypothetical protein
MTWISYLVSAARRTIRQFLLEVEIGCEAGEMSAWYEARCRHRTAKQRSSDRHAS